jgi:hypothetical protein
MEFSRQPGRESVVVDVRECSLLAYCSEEDEGLPTKDLREEFDLHGCQWRGEHLRDCESG